MNEALRTMLDDEIGGTELARILRRYNHAVGVLLMENARKEVNNLEWILEGQYWTNEMCERMDPYLNK